MEFKPFPKIERIGKIQMSITQKIHGTNAQVYIIEGAETVQDGQHILHLKYPDNIVEVNNKLYTIFVGSRTRWITPENDNYGFASHVYSNKQEFVEKLGVGQHFGEWAGPGINLGEGLTEKTFFLFNFFKFPMERPLPPQTSVVPVLYQGAFDLNKIDECMEALKRNGSLLAPGYMKPEGIVINTLGDKFKKVFDDEETKWRKSDVPKVDYHGVDISHLLQPIRLQKLLSRDERYIVGYPETIGNIIKDYITDLIEEKQFDNTDAIILKALKKQMYSFIKAHCEKA